jgi:hypothetical protein
MFLKTATPPRSVVEQSLTEDVEHRSLIILKAIRRKNIQEVVKIDPLKIKSESSSRSTILNVQ